MPEWMKKLAKDENDEFFSQLVHDYFKLATMRVMQVIREKFEVPPENINTLVLAITARLLNESCYAVGGAILNGMPLFDIISKEQATNLLKVLNGEFLDQKDRMDIDTEHDSSLAKFKKFIIENANNFYL